ncbi:MAG: autotransporter-associated beta strand repeat-containing protein, partial [Opitutaceae bacterium]|nr:autotransporter-associated beta strand repeat-containing protein [Opitutaceae bacterium]
MSLHPKFMSVKSAPTCSRGVVTWARRWSAVLMGLGALGLPLSAQTLLYWDVNGATAGASAGTTATGTWNQSTTSAWSTSSAGTSATDDWSARVPNGGTGGIAIFAAGTNATGTYTVNVSGSVGNTNAGRIAGIRFDEGTLTLARVSSGMLYIRGSGITNNTANTQTINAYIQLDAAQTWDVGTGGMNVGGVISGSNNLTKAGTGTLTLTGSNTFTGVTTVTDGVLSVGTINNGGVAGNLGQATNAADRIVLDGGTLRYTGGWGSTDRLFTIGTAGGTLDASGSGPISFTNTGNLGLSGTNTARTFTLTGTNTGTNTLSAVLGDNGTGATSLTKDGAGTWILTGANTYTGDTTVNAGILQVNASERIADTSNLVINSGGTFQFNWGTLTETVGTLSGAGTLSMRGSTFITSTAADSTFSGTITDSYGNFRKDGAGNLTLSGNNTYSGLTYIDGGTLIAASNTALGTATYGNVIANGATLGLQGGITLAESSFDLQGTGDGGVGAINNISGDNTLTSALTFTGATTIGAAAGSLTLTNQLSLGSAVTMTGAGNITASGNITGASSLTKDGTGTLTITGSAANSYSGGTNVNDGTVVLAMSTAESSGGALSSGAINIGDGTGAAGSAVVRLNANDQIANYAGTTTIASDGRLDLNDYNETLNQIAGTGSITLGSGNITLGINGGSSTFGGVISGTGNLIKENSGTLTLSGANTYTGTTTVNGSGTLALGVDNALSDATAVTVNSGATFALGSYTDTVGSIAGGGALNLGTGHLTAGANNTSTTYSGVISGSGDLTKTGTGTLTVSGTNTHTGTTTVSGGTLLAASNAALGAATADAAVTAGTLALDGGVTITKTTGTLSLAGTGTGANTGALHAAGGTGTTSQWIGDITLTGD